MQKAIRQIRYEATHKLQSQAVNKRGDGMNDIVHMFGSHIGQTYQQKEFGGALPDKNPLAQLEKELSQALRLFPEMKIIEKELE